jgi:eukaryotic-like serine/threonine-protein kinase
MPQTSRRLTAHARTHIQEKSLMAAAERDLLFGLLALQNGLIEQDQLIAAFRAWSRNKVRPIADLLVERGGLDSDDRAAVEALVGRHLTKHGGSAEQSLAAINVVRSIRASLARVPDTDVEASLVHLGHGSTQAAEDADRTASYAVGTATSDGQRFRVLRPHAQGGLGAVFVALDSELNREVALKQILDRHADDETSRKRFLLEAEITGGLEHPGIVPVYGLGSYCDGRPYYAMRFIRGDSLKGAIERFQAHPAGARDLELRKLLRRFVDVCNAVDYAHSRGVLHRDIKPGNIIVGKYGETLVVDWGLAKVTGRSDSSAEERTLIPKSASGSAETLPGSALGTPAYMSPEQARGELDRLGPCSDVYSLGATLYCLLTGKPPVDGDDIGAILRSVQRGEFRAPRQLDPSIDRALEAICKKAMALQPDDRYASPKVLADDLERWMADEPVTAWHEPLSRRGRRWARRNRTAVTAALVALVAGLVGLSAVATVQARANGELRAANTEVKRVNTDLAAEKARVQERYDLAMEAIKTFHTGVSEDFLLKEEKFKDLRDRLLKSASDFYGKLGALLKGRSDMASRRALGQANFELAELTTKVGRTEAALAAHEQVLEYRQAMAVEPGADDESQAETGRSLLAVGELQEEIGKTADSEASYEEARRSLIALVASQPGIAVYRADLATAESRLGWLFTKTGQSDEGLSFLERCRDARVKLVEANPNVIQFQTGLASIHNDIGFVLVQTGRPAAALESYSKAMAIQQRLADANPGVTRFQNDLARTHTNTGHLMRNTGKTAASLESHGRAVAIQQKLADANPNVSLFQSDLAISHNSIGNLHRDTGKTVAAIESQGKALVIQQRLADANPSVTRFQRELAWTHNAIGLLQRDMGESTAALESYGKALAIQQKLADTYPSVTRFQNELAISHTDIGELLRQTGQSAAALSSFRKALEIQQRLVDANPSVTGFRRELAISHNSIGNLLRDTGEPQAALASHGKALAIQQKLVDANPSVTGFQNALAWSHKSIGGLLRDTGKPAAALESFGKALAIQQKLVDANPSVTGFQSALAEFLLSTGFLLAQIGRLNEAFDLYVREESIRRTLLERDPTLPDYQNGLASCQTNMAEVLIRTGRLAEARLICDRALATLEALVRDHREIVYHSGVLAEILLRDGQVRAGQGDPVGAARAWGRSLSIYDGMRSLTGEQMFFRACCHACLSGLASRAGSNIAADVGHVDAGLAMQWLRRDVAAGYRSFGAYRNESGLNPIRSRPDFRLLMMDLAFPAEPFVRGD